MTPQNDEIQIPVHRGENEISTTVLRCISPTSERKTKNQKTKTRKKPVREGRMRVENYISTL